MKEPHIDEQEYQAFLSTLPEHMREEHFCWLTSSYCIPKALFLVRKLNIALMSIDVQAWAKAIGMGGPRDVAGNNFNIFNGVSDNDALQPHVNPDFPLVVVEHTWKVGRKTEKSPLIIDGNKRLRKAFIEGREKMGAYFLPADLAKYIKTERKRR